VARKKRKRLGAKKKSAQRGNSKTGKRIEFKDGYSTLPLKNVEN